MKRITFLTSTVLTALFFAAGTAFAVGAGGGGAGAGGANAGSAGSAGAGGGGSYSPGDGSHDGGSWGTSGTDVTSGTNVTSASTGSASVQSTPLQTRDRIQDPTTHTGDEPLQTRDRDRLYTSTTSTSTGSGAQYQGGNGPAGQGNATGTASNGYQYQYRLRIDPEHLQIRAGSGAELGQMVQAREQQLQSEAANAAPVNRPLLENASRMRVAVYGMLAAQNLLGPGIGPQVAQIAGQIDSTVPAAANVEAQVQTRGFWTRLFFGGDKQAGDALAQMTSQNQAQLQTLTQLLSQASTTPEVRAQLQTQIEAMQQEQDRLSQIAEREQSQGGLFSWRF